MLQDSGVGVALLEGAVEEGGAECFAEELVDEIIGFEGSGAAEVGVVVVGEFEECAHPGVRVVSPVGQVVQLQTVPSIRGLHVLH